ncbi:MAG: glycoside hydrolase family 16 protein, partial [Xanthomonadales bacterium]
MPRFLPSSLALVVVTLLTRPASAQVLWSDEFDAGPRPDPATWSYDLGAGGWGNRELQAYTDRPANVRV